MAKRKQSRRANLDTQSSHAMLSQTRNRKRGLTKQRLAATLGFSANLFGSNATNKMIGIRRSGGRSQDRPPLSMWPPIETALRLGRNVGDLVNRPLQINRNRGQTQRFGPSNAAQQVVPQPPQSRAARKVFGFKHIVDHKCSRIEANDAGLVTSMLMHSLVQILNRQSLDRLIVNETLRTD